MSRGAHDLEALRERSIVDDETGCWIVRGAQYNGTTYLWCPPAGKTLSLTAAMAWLLTGKPAAPRQLWVAMCGNRTCGNPAHRKLGTRRLLMQVMRPKLDPLHRTRIQAEHLRRVPMYSPELRARIQASDESCAAMGRQLGMSPSTVNRIRLGKSWARLAPAASVFNLAAKP